MNLLIHDLSEKEFESILKEYPNDKTAQMFVERCQKLKDNPPDNSWDGVYRLNQK